MSELKLKCLTLFILHIAVNQGRTNIDEQFINQLNYFVIKCYEDKKELFDLICDPEIIEISIERQSGLLSLRLVNALIEEHNGLIGYEQLTHEVGKELDEQLFRLALYFLEFNEAMVRFYLGLPSNIQPKGYPRILQ